MSKKAAILRHLNMRAIKAVFYSAVCRLPWLRKFFNYYQDVVCFEEAANEGSIQELRIDPVNEYDTGFSESEIGDLLRCKDVSAESLMLVFKTARITDVTILGSSGVTLDNRTGKVLGFGRSPGRLSGNLVVARPLKTVFSDESAIYINLLWLRKGHRHFAHFFWDMLLPVLVFLKNWHDPDERLIFLVREDLSAIQRDTFQFLTRDHPNISFQTLPANQKMVCAKSIYIAFQHKFHGVANTLAREYMRGMAEFYLRHYEIKVAPAGPGKRIYISREGAAIRRVTNEPDLLAMLSRYGFESIEPGSIPFSRQAELFQSADIVVAPHGAALANLMFCRPGARILEFFPADYIDDCYLRISKAMELDYHYLFGGTSSFPRRNYDMNTDKLEAALKAMLDA